MPIPLSPESLAKLRCPKTHQALHLVSDDELAPWKALAPDTTQFLATEDGKIAYPVDDGYPILLLDRLLERAAGD